MANGSSQAYKNAKFVTLYITSLFGSLFEPIKTFIEQRMTKTPTLLAEVASVAGKGEISIISLTLHIHKTIHKLPSRSQTLRYNTLSVQH